MAYARNRPWLATTLLLYGLSACSAQPKTQAEASPSASPGKRVVSASLDQIQNQFASDHAGAAQKYSAIAVQFTAIAESVSADAKDGTAITFATAEHPQPITAHFTEDGERPASAVKPGAMVPVKCELVAEVASKLELSGCTLRS